MQCLKARIDYAQSPEKTDDGRLISAYACTPETADQEFMLARNAYMLNTGKRIQGEVIAYQFRQSFKPGEVTPEEANQIGYELASKFLKNDHAFIVATHQNTSCVHNHIIVCSTALDCRHKFRNFRNSAQALADMSDQICREHGLSVVTQKNNVGVSYDKWQGRNVKPTQKEKLCMTIDDLLTQNPEGFDALMQLLEEAGWRIKRAKQYSFCPPDGKKFIRMDTLGEAYSEAALRKTLAGEQTHTPKKYRGYVGEVGLIIDIKEKRRAGKGKGYERWAERFNTEATAKTMVYIKNHKIENRAMLEQMISTMSGQRDDLQSRIAATDARMDELIALRKTITDYRRTRDVYMQYHASGWSKEFYAAHKEQIDIHMKAKQQYDAVRGQMPKLNEISEEFDRLKTQKQVDRSDLRALTGELKELQTVKANLIEILDTDENDQTLEQENNEKQRSQ